MAVYYGVVKGNTIILPADVRLEEGTTVEVHVPAADTGEHAQSGEADFHRKLIALGLLDPHEPVEPLPPLVDEAPVPITGKPLSETIIEERH